MEDAIKIEHRGINFDIAFRYRKGNETLVFIHGLIRSESDFSLVWNLPYFKKYGILTFDLPGFGDSSKPEKFPYGMEEQAEICTLLIKKLGIDKIHLIGHSMGGVIALLLANKIPGKLKSFINLEGNLIGEDCSLSRKISKMQYEEFLNKKGIIGDNDPNSAYKSSKSLVDWADSGKLLKLFLGLKTKKEYFSSDRSVLPCIRLLKGKVDIITVPNSGHMLMKDNPRELYKKISAVL